MSTNDTATQKKTWLLHYVATNNDPHWWVEEWDRETNPGCEARGGMFHHIFDSREEAEKWGADFAEDCWARAKREEAR